MSTRSSDSMFAASGSITRAPSSPADRSRTAAPSASGPLCSSVRPKFMRGSPQPWQSEHPLGDNVLQHVGGAALDRVRLRAQEPVAPLLAPGEAVGAEDLGREIRHLLVEVGPLPLRYRSL